jgi:hypothetical protein
MGHHKKELDKPHEVYFYWVSKKDSDLLLINIKENFLGIMNNYWLEGTFTTKSSKLGNLVGSTSIILREEIERFQTSYRGKFSKFPVNSKPYHQEDYNKKS